MKWYLEPMSSDERQKNRDLFRDCLSGPLVQRFALHEAKSLRKRKSKGRKKDIKLVKDEVKSSETLQNQVEELGEFIDVRIIRGRPLFTS